MRLVPAMEGREAVSNSSALILDRHEYKCLVSPDLIPALRDAVATACRRDPFANEDGQYTIRSLYLDTMDWRLFWANEREQSDRFKARIRCYPGAPQAPVFLEIKRRVTDTIYKTRVGVPAADWRQVVLDLDHLDSVRWRSPMERALAERFLYFQRLHHLQPAVMVEYDREAWVSTVDHYARATFDLRIRAQPVDEWSLEVNPRRWKALDHPVRTITTGPVAVFELKFGRTAPPWMTAMVRRFDLQRFAFSKYAYGVWEHHMPPTSRQHGDAAGVGAGGKFRDRFGRVGL